MASLIGSTKEAMWQDEKNRPLTKLVIQILDWLSDLENNNFELQFSHLGNGDSIFNRCSLRVLMSLNL